MENFEEKLKRRKHESIVTRACAAEVEQFSHKLNTIIVTKTSHNSIERKTMTYFFERKSID